MIDWRFLGGMAALMALAAWPAFHWVERFPGGQGGLAAGLGYSLVSLGVGYHWLRRNASRTIRRFAIVLVGGFLARALGLLVFALTLAYATGVNLAVALLTVVATHLVLGMAEIVYLHRTDALR
ncbi:MAG TPA: hypothetical protein VM737_10140 [Gemmatimonadota bacterium]|nr:hypothetical protein [Gemmatimonadota bacterium]